MIFAKDLLLVFSITVAGSMTALGHSGVNHQAEPRPVTPSLPEQMSDINKVYLDKVKPIFKKKCFDCHSQYTAFPWYHKLPGVKTMLDRDVKEGRKHIDMSNDFPFIGHGSPASDLRAIEKVVREGSMPPFRYRLLHWDSSLSQEEKDIILEWTRQGQERLNPH